MYYYTYAFLREDKTPYYIGKGKGDRAYRRRDKGIKPPKDKSRILILKQNLTEEEAFRHEVYMIAVFGRKDLGTGILHNRTDGGDGVSGLVHSEKTRKKMSELGKCRTHSEKTKIKMSKVQKGRTFSQETKRKMSETHKGKTLSEEHKTKICMTMKGRHVGERNPFYGKNHSDEHRRKISESQKGKKWWNDGCGNTKISVDCPGDDWVAGRKLKQTT
tara:strand:+ start:251 stop:901 length:651 start_codon:yes stop_codon:yes gene_type:complete